MKKLAPFAFLAAIATPSMATACMHMMNVTTYASDYMAGGVLVATLVFCLFGKKLRGRPWMTTGVVASAMLTSYMMGAFLAHTSDLLEFRSMGYIASFGALILIPIAGSTTKWRRGLGLAAMVFVFSTLTLSVMGDHKQAGQSQSLYDLQTQEVTF